MSTPAKQCALCLRPSELINSHIIPEFVYLALYDQKHRFHQLKVSEGESRFGQKGYREPLLCFDCEQKFSVHEKYVSELFAGRRQATAQQTDRMVRLSGLSYHHFKLFGLSILWRAGVASHSFFSKVELGPHGEKLRQMLLADDPGPRLKYAFLVSPMTSGDSGYIPDDIIVEPTRARFDGHLCYRFVFCGMIWTFLVSSHRLVPPISTTTLSEQGDMQMLVTPMDKVDFVMRSILEYLRAESA